MSEFEQVAKDMQRDERVTRGEPKGEYYFDFKHEPENFIEENAKKIEGLFASKDMYPDTEANSLVSQVIEANKDLAYDGSNEPPKRDLTARERDILVRLINNILDHGRRYPPIWNDDPPFPGWSMLPVPIMIGESNFFDVLRKIREAIDPREEE